MNVIEQITAEVRRATAKYPTWPTDPLHALAVLGEEYGELNKAMLQLTYEPQKTSLEEVRTEAIQTAAMAMRLAMSLDIYRYTPCHQHSQSQVPMPHRVTSKGNGHHITKIQQLIADDAFACTFQTLGQYRAALLQSITATAEDAFNAEQAKTGGMPYGTYGGY